ncbi:hypothetical protein FEM33_01640 [Dyadobacter flavalbus]|uniref:Uncharacterized protein n=1 Tax=Dyadobacter flavalbus TaxID=2579942 RepID=A0A5M8R3T7_9BACT|nr:hypothetical protein [Dyadobacter flavalbus]KAA6441463.1 hypothetical protein FEM33_01640 [Dyadobacter flavalbus]
MAGVTANLNDDGYVIDTTNDSIVIVERVMQKIGGTTLDVTNFGPSIIKSGHVIIKETATGNYKPMPLATNDTVYGSLPAGHTYAGILTATILTKAPFASILEAGKVNIVAMPYPVAPILTALKAALPLIIFTQD